MDLKDIVNTTITVIDLLKANVVQAMPALATALPRGVDPLATDPTWSSEPQMVLLALTFPHAYPLPEPFRLADDGLKIGVRWNYSGQVGGKGRYIKDLEAFVLVDHISATMTYDIAVKFAETGTPINAPSPDGPIAMLTGSFTLRVSQFSSGVLFSNYFGIRVFGNGSGDIKQIS